MIARIPIRLRLAVTFAALMAIVLTATGLFVYEQLRRDLDSQIERELEARSAGVDAIVRDDGDDLGDPEQAPLERVDEVGFVQVLRGGEVADATSPRLKERPVLSEESAAALLDDEATPTVDVFVPELNDDLRLTAQDSRDDGVDYTILVGASLSQRNSALDNLRSLLLIGGPVALLLGSLFAYGIATGALRPVESMRRRAAEISTGRSSQRLPVPAAKDEIADLGETLNQMLDRIERSFQRERAFVDDASHELRTPLTILRAELARALEGGRSQAELEEALGSAAEETERLVRLSEDLLVLARADAGRLPIRSEEIDLEDMLARLRDRFADRAGSDGRALNVDAPLGSRVRADPARLEQALSNLVDNALRYGQGDVTLSVAANGSDVQLTVADGGAGFDAELLPEALERFTRAERGGTRGGSGLGLAIVAAIAEAHGGHAEVASGGGGRVTIALPRGGPPL